MSNKQFYKEELGRLIAENSDLKKSLRESQENFRRLERLYTFGTPTDGLEVGSPEDYGDAPIIYESPDGGKTIYQRRAGDYENKELVGGEQMELFKK